MDVVAEDGRAVLPPSDPGGGGSKDSVAAPTGGSELMPMPADGSKKLVPLAGGSEGAMELLGRLCQTHPALAETIESLFDEDPRNVAEYSADVFDKMRCTEALHVLGVGYMEHQREISGVMRAILVDWLVEVHVTYSLRAETLFLTVHLIDRYLARVPVRRRRLQLIGVAAMLVSSKVEEISPPDLLDYVHITDKTYPKEEILEMECRLLTELNFALSCPTVLHFLERLTHLQPAARSSSRQLALTLYLAELALLEVGMAARRPSHVAAAVLLLSNELVGLQPTWPIYLAELSWYAEASLRSTADELYNLYEAAPQSPQQATFRKFGASEWYRISTVQLQGRPGRRRPLGTRRLPQSMAQNDRVVRCRLGGRDVSESITDRDGEVV